MSERSERDPGNTPQKNPEPAKRATEGWNVTHVIDVALKLFVVEYSVSEENSPSVRTLEKVLIDNIDNVRRGLPKDYLPVGLFVSREDADRFVEKFNFILAREDQTAMRWQRLADILQNSLQEFLSDPDIRHEDENKTAEKLD